MSSGTMLSRVLGYVRDAVLMAAFSRTVTDAFIVAFRLPNLVRRLLGEGSLSVSFIPVYVDQLAQDESGERARRLANATYTLLSSVTLTLTLLGFILMPQVIELWVGDKAGFAAIPGKLELTITLSRIMIAYVYLVTLFAFLSGIANAHHRFFMPAVAPAIFNFVMIVFALWPEPANSVPGSLLAWGVVVGGVLQTGLVGVALYRMGHLPRWTLKIQAAGLKTVLVNLGPGLVGLGIYQVMTIANTFFAARLPEGTQTYIYNSDRILELPQSIVAISLGTALLPTFARLLSRGEKAAMLDVAADGLKTMLFLALPAAVGMGLLAQPIIQLLFMRGQFGPADVQATAEIVQIYATLLVVSSLAKVTVPGFYAMKNTWFPAVVAGLVLLVHLMLASFWVETYGVAGLAMATTVSGALNMLVLQIGFRWMIGPVGLHRVVVATLRMAPGLAAMAAVIKWTFPWLVEISRGVSATLSLVFALGLTIALSAVVYFIVCSWCGSAEASKTLALFRQRRRRKA